MQDYINAENICRFIMFANTYALVYMIWTHFHIRRVEKERDNYKKDANQAQSKVWCLEGELTALKNPPKPKDEVRVLNIGDRYRHFTTGGIYKIITLFTWEPTKEPAVVYESESTGERWGHTISVFLEGVAKPGEDGVKVPRFAIEAEADPTGTKAPTYFLQEAKDENGALFFNVYGATGDPVATLKGGMSGPIALCYVNMSGQDQQRGDDYMAGVIHGCTHMTLLNQAPASTSESPTA